MRLQSSLVALLLLAAACCLPRAAHAAESYDSCNNFIDSLPATISTQGVWCLRHDLATNIASGNAIEIAASNVTLDCNDFKLGGLAAGASSQANGIHADANNTVIRHCNIRGFLYGINIYGVGQLVEDNRLDNNLLYGIYVNSSGTSNVVRGNRVFDTGESTVSTSIATGISAAADIVDNIVDGVVTSGTTTAVTGIEAFGNGVQVRGNRVGGLAINGGGAAFGISASIYGYQTIAGNHVASGGASVFGTGINGRFDSANTAKTRTFCKDNIVTGFSYAIANCLNAGGNYPNY
jgi:hypothetical protein